MSTFAMIFARGGSKGLPNKNIKLLNGKPLIAYSIEQALRVNEISRVIVSTDCPHIQKVAKDYGADTPFLRPISLADDSSPEWLSWQHALLYLRDIENDFPNNFISLPAVAPLRSIDDIQKCLEKFRGGDCDAVVTITKSSHSPYFNMVSKNNDGQINILADATTEHFRRQDTPQSFNLTTVAYVLSSEFVLNNKSIFSGRVKAVEIPAERAIDIDNLLDFEIAEFLMTRKVK